MQSFTQIMQKQLGPIQTREIGQEVCECGELVKIREVSLRGKLHTHRVGCRCEDMAEVRKILAENEAARKNKITRVFDSMSLINPDLQLATFDNYAPVNDSMAAAKQETQEFVDNFEPEKADNLLLTGDFGVGKSHLGVAMLKALMDRDFSCIFIAVPDFLTKLKATYNKKSELSEDELLDALKRVDVLVFDELGPGIKKADETPEQAWAVTKMFEVVNARQGKSTIYTTNHNSKELQQLVGGRNFSRLCYNTHVIKITGPDMRIRTMW